jgi:GT2 family glycosyltransferase
MTPSHLDDSTALVAIGRNEGKRLERCLDAARKQLSHVVYVDSGSTDGSVKLAERLGVEVVALDMSRPFTAARARNAGLRRAQEIRPGLEYVQFVDGDCELDPAWLERAHAFLAEHPHVAVVSGRVRERFPDASIYNRLCDLEWDTPIGRTDASGGNAFIRVRAFDEVDGFAPELIAGEEPDLCYRLRARGWEIWRLDAEMVLHDAAMTRFSEWWTRSKRSGHATAEALARRGFGERTSRRQVLSNLVWAAPPAWPLWPVLWLRIYGRRRDGAYATFTVLGKVPHAQGQLGYWAGRLRRQRVRLIEYK